MFAVKQVSQAVKQVSQAVKQASQSSGLFNNIVGTVKSGHFVQSGHVDDSSHFYQDTSLIRTPH